MDQVTYEKSSADLEEVGRVLVHRVTLQSVSRARQLGWTDQETRTSR